MTQAERTTVMTPGDLMVLGLEQVAYVRPVAVDGGTAYAIHAADGTEITVMASRDSALAAIRQNDLEPLSVH